MAAKLKYNYATIRGLHPEYFNGLMHAAEFVNDYSNGHDYLIGDCLLAKLNLIIGGPRKNHRRNAVEAGRTVRRKPPLKQRKGVIRPCCDICKKVDLCPMGYRPGCGFRRRTAPIA